MMKTETQDWEDSEHATLNSVPPSDNGRNIKQDETSFISPQQRSMAKLQHAKEETKTKVEALDNPDIKLLSGAQISHESIGSRLEAIGGLDPYPINLPDKSAHCVSRDWISYTFGGSSQGMKPSIDKKRFNHGIDNFYFLTYDYNPALPKKPGYPGLQFSSRKLDPSYHLPVKKLMTRISAGNWLYMGEYETLESNPLTKEEWLAQPPKFRNFWSNKIHTLKWGQYIRYRIAYRAQHGRSPTDEEFNAASDELAKLNVTPEQINQAISQGDEKMHVSALRCIGFDNEFQKKLETMPENWTRPSISPKVPKKANVRGTQSPKTPKYPKQRKRKRTSVTDEEAESGIASETNDGESSSINVRRLSKKQKRPVRARKTRGVAIESDGDDSDIEEISSDDFYNPNGK